jgi:hypothetical protein
MSLLLALMSLFGSPGAVSPTVGAMCSISSLRENPEGYFYPLAAIRRFVLDAQVIVRAVAVGTDSVSLIEDPAFPDAVVFRVLEVLRGAEPVTRLILQGKLVPRDDFNSGPVPYRMVRGSGQRGDCSAREYRLGAEYLFLLRSRAGGWTPHWAGLAPLNEQIRGGDDPWVVWVRRELGS